MKKVGIAVALLTAGMGLATTAKADVDLFDTNAQQIDSSINLRRSTTEQEDPIRGQSVLDRPRPDFDPVPIPVGSFQLFPALNLGTYYNDNVFAVQNSQIADQVWTVNPTATLASNWGRNSVVLTGTGDFGYYDDQTKQDFYTGAVQAEGRYDIAEQTWLAGVLGYQRVVEARGGLDTPGNSVGPSLYDLYTDGVTAYRGVGQVKASLDYNSKYYNYSTLNLIGGGINNQDPRDRMENNVGTEVDYEVTKNFSPYVHAAYNWRNYTADGGANSSNGYQLDAGSKMDFGGVTTANLYLGYLSQDYFNYSNGVTNGFDFGADVLWNITPLTSIEGKTSRSIQETTFAFSPSAFTTQASVQISHELRRDLILQANMVYYAFDFQDSTRNDNVYDAGAGARYYLNRNIYTDLTYDFERRNSTDSSNNYGQNVVFARIGLQY